jgi:hypothetical protein
MRTLHGQTGKLATVLLVRLPSRTPVACGFVCATRVPYCSAPTACRISSIHSCWLKWYGLCSSSRVFLGERQHLTSGNAREPGCARSL